MIQDPSGETAPIPFVDIAGDVSLRGLIRARRHDVTEEDVLAHFKRYSQRTRESTAELLVMADAETAILHPGEDTSLNDYFGTIHNVLLLGKEASSTSAKVWLSKTPEILRAGAEQFLTLHPEQRDEFVRYGVEYGTHLHGLYDVHGLYAHWATVVNRCADLTQQQKRVLLLHGTLTGGDEAADHLLDSSQPEAVWRAILGKSLERAHMQRKGVYQDYRHYLLGPGIEAKDPLLLMEAADRAETEWVSQLLGFNRTGQDMVIARFAYDNFRYILQEAADSGWKNARRLADGLEALPKRDQPHNALIVHMGNLVTDSINQAIASEGIRLEKLHPMDPANVAEAINRCLYVVFEFGEQAEGHEALNYLISGELIGTIFRRLNIGQTRAASSTSSIDRQAGKYRELEAATQHNHTFWNRWKAGYGLIS